jgi:hypothetical protein
MGRGPATLLELDRFLEGVCRDALRGGIKLLEDDPDASGVDGAVDGAS